MNKIKSLRREKGFGVDAGGGCGTLRYCSQFLILLSAWFCGSFSWKRSVLSCISILCLALWLFWANGVLTNVSCKQRFRHTVVSDLFSCFSPFTVRRASPVCSWPFSLRPRVNTWMWEGRNDSGRIVFRTHLISTKQTNKQKKNREQLSNKTENPPIFQQNQVRKHPSGLWNTRDEEKSLIVTRPVWYQLLCRNKQWGS